MDRRSFLKATSASAAALAGAVAPAAFSGTAQAAAPVPLAPGAKRIAVRAGGSADLPGPAQNLSRISQRVARLSGGTLGLVPAGAGEDVAGRLVWTDELAGLDPAFAFFAGLPGRRAATAHEMLTWMAAGGGQDLFDDLAGRYGLRAMLAGHSGPHAGLWWSGGRRTGNLRQARVAAEGSAARVLGRMDATVVPGDAAMAAAALLRQEVAAAEIGGPLTTLALGLHAADDVVLGPSVQPQGRTAVLAIADEAWSGLTAAEQAMVALSASEETWQSLAEQSAHAGLARRIFEESGIRRLDWPADVLAALDAAGRDVRDEAASASPLAERIAASYAAVAEGASPSFVA